MTLLFVSFQFLSKIMRYNKIQEFFGIFVKTIVQEHLYITEICFVCTITN